MIRLVVFGSVLLLAALECQGQQVTKEFLQKVGKEAQSPSLSVSAETRGSSESAQSSAPNNLKPKPKKLQFGGSLIDLVSGQADSPSAADESEEPVKLKGFQLLNPFAPVTKKPQSPLNWKAKRGRGFRFQNPKEGEPEGFKLFFLGF